MATARVLAAASAPVDRLRPLADEAGRLAAAAQPLLPHTGDLQVI